MANVWGVKAVNKDGEVTVFPDVTIHHGFNALKAAVKQYTAEHGQEALRGMVDYQVTLVRTDG